ncbi:hypothetical protein NUU61_008971 [Penicillium alfredii]|uniref:Rhodanese domain-containing protein n=1 Tax=Penicillium alfredii TaxID=1506179 RepID=A0A9W9JX81_9EURO|nr:uncharacterized protein NUU61_008971 [Penicillium alfredii]KAJ5084392.1 hypothetical protein NUU61_008971 [Penicillium alfredii]
MAPLFSNRLTCFYCGRRSTQSLRGVRKFRCEHCEADNYLDENGEITDPPATETNPTVHGPDASSPPFETAEFTDSGLFCSTCTRNQHLFTSSLASYFPSPDDPMYAVYERDYPEFRRGLEDRYPQVCDVCEPRVRQRIRQTGYEAKADHLRRMMDRSRASKAARRARNRNWRSVLVLTGALGYWSSVVGQLAWDVMSALTAIQIPEGSDTSPVTPPSWVSCVRRTVEMRRVPGQCAFDLAPSAGLALVAGSLSLWWNPKLRMKVEGIGGRFAGLGEYYKVQLIALVVRCVFWAVLKDPSASGLEPTLPPALHMFMIIFTVLSVGISRRVVKYDTRPLVDWSDHTWENAPLRSAESSPVSAARSKPTGLKPNPNMERIGHRFPIEKLGSPRPSPEQAPAIPTPPPETDDMDWTPSTQQEIRPTVSVYQRNQPSVFDGPSPFHGALPPAPKPPAWNLRTQPSTKPLEQVVERNPFHQNPSQPPSQWQHKDTTSEPVFKPPKFFPMSDHDTSTGLETLFDRAFTIQTDDAPRNRWAQQEPSHSSYPRHAHNFLIIQYLRLGLLVVSISAWTLSQNHQLSIPGNYIEIGALGSASLLAGFALLEAAKRPLAQWNGMEILVYITELGAAVHLGAHLPMVSFEREYFDRYGKLLLIFMVAQEVLGLVAFYRVSTATSADGQSSARPASQHASPQPQPPQLDALALSPSEPADSPFVPRSFGSQLSAPPLSFSSTAGTSSFSSALPSVPQNPQYRLSSSQSLNSLSSHQNRNPHSFTMKSLKESEPSSDYEQDSDSETVATTATTLTDATTRNIRYGRNPNLEHNPPFSPRRSELGPGIGGLSLEDRPAPRHMTRSQTQQGLMGRRFPSRA